jgi:hypothetical protein
MSHRRTIRKGSFGDDLETLVKALETTRSAEADKRMPKSAGRVDHATIHDRLYERAWRPRKGASRTNDGRKAHH